VDECVIIWTAYMIYRLKLRDFSAETVETCVRYSTERYFDTATERRIAVGRNGDRLIMVAYDRDENQVTPVTVHTTSRQQINVRIATGRYTHE